MEVTNKIPWPNSHPQRRSSPAVAARSISVQPGPVRPLAVQSNSLARSFSSLARLSRDPARPNPATAR
ncbi:hypothetical protein CRG98_022016 [Punica granatum]|uniref:Uncharacterized protein n=1 Tax=Punica granatum TaxID=22663 RepID=A0A2I0JMN6_PUNGR|nr:hypothetical protein CRG98_022016 [Punica granatum]